ncbi:MAG TPA: hypothetical protein VN371_07355, partial [Chlorobaculum sp.]|nr:hypothetical protein [Chlorobaculum sp.]
RGKKLATALRFIYASYADPHKNTCQSLFFDEHTKKMYSGIRSFPLLGAWFFCKVKSGVSIPGKVCQVFRAKV